MNRRRDFFINSGIPGERVASLHADFEWRVLHFRPDIVSIMIDMNDAVAGPAGRAAFEAELRAMVEQVRAAGAIPVLHRTKPIDTKNPDSLRRSDLPVYNEIIRQVARDTNTILIDHWARWQGARPTPAALRDGLADPIHPNGSGHRQVSIARTRRLRHDNPIFQHHLLRRTVPLNPRFQDSLPLRAQGHCQR